MGTSITPECGISSARVHSMPESMTAGLMMYLYVLSRSSVRPVSKSVFFPKPITTKHVDIGGSLA
jgi:hypothetical protein